MLIAALQHWRVDVWVALLALAAGQTVRIDAARAALAQERANHEAAALAAQVASANKTLAVERAHAAAQQRIADDFAREKQKMEDARVADAAVARGLRDRLAAATAKQHPKKITLTPLGASVTGIGLKPSANWPEKVSNYLRKVETFSSSATTK